MDELRAVLAATLQASDDVRNSAEARLTELREMPGYISALLSLVVEAGADAAGEYERQAAAIQLKNVVERYWTPISSDKVRFSDEDKSFVRSNLIEAVMLQTNSAVLKCLCAVAATIAREDYPDRWEDMPASLVANIKSMDEQRIHNSVLVMRIIAKSYEFRKREMRAPLDMMAAQVFPLLHDMFAHYLTQNTLQAAIIMKLTLKVFWSCTQFLLPSFMADGAMCDSWFAMFNTLLAKPLPEASEGLEPLEQPTDPDAREDWPWWKAKKWVSHIIGRCLKRYGILKYAAPEDQEFAKAFQAGPAAPLTATVINVLKQRHAGVFVSKRVTQLCIAFITEAVDSAKTYKLVRPENTFLLFEVVVPLLQFTHEDNELWQRDPTEFLRRYHDVEVAYKDPRTSAQELLLKLGEKRGKDCMPKIMHFMGNTCQHYAAQDAASRDYALKDGALAVLGCISYIMIEHTKYKKQIESILTQHVFTEFESPMPFLRSRACWVFSQYANVKFRIAHHYETAITCVLNLLRDTEMPVRFMAAASLKMILLAETKSVEKVLDPVLGELIEAFFSMMSELGVDDVVTALEALLARFGHKVADICVPLAEKLMAIYQQFQTELEEGDEDEELALAAMSCLGTVCTMVQSVQDFPDKFEALEVVCAPTIEALLSPEACCQDDTETALDLLANFTYFSPTISPTLWRIFVFMLKAHKAYMFDYIEKMIVPIDNVIGRDTETFLAGFDEEWGQSYLQMTYEVVTRTLEHGNEDDAGTSVRIFMSLLQHCEGRIDEVATSIVTLIAGKMIEAKTMPYKVCLAQVLACACLYNTPLTLATLEGLGATAKVMGVWMEALPRHKSRTEAKLCSLGLCALLRVPPSEQPPTIVAGLPQLVQALLQVMLIVKAKQQDAEEESDAEVSDDEYGLPDKGDGADPGVHAGEDVHDESDEAYYARLAKIQKKIDAAKAEGKDFDWGDAEGSDGDSDASSEGGDEDDDGPLGKYRTFAFYHDTISAWQGSAETAAQLAAISEGMPDELKAAAAEFMEVGAKQKEQLVAEAARAAEAGAGGGAA